MSLADAEVRLPPDSSKTVDIDGIVWQNLPDEETASVTVDGSNEHIEVEVEPERLDVGEAHVSEPGLEITITNIELQDTYSVESRDREYEADEEEQFVFIDLEITNIGDEEQRPPAAIRFDLLYEEEEYSTAYVFKDEGEYDPDVDGRLEPGETESGWIAYEVPDTAEREEIIIQYTTSASDDVDVIRWS